MPSLFRYFNPGEIRFRILLFFSISITALLAIAIPVSKGLITNQIKQREEANMTEKIMSFNEFFLEHIEDLKDPSPDQLRQLMKDYLRSELPEDDNFLISIINSEFHASSPIALPAPLRPGSALMTRWMSLTTATSGDVLSGDKELGSILYRTQPLAVGGRVRGIFVTAITTGGELQEASAVVDLLTFIFLMLVLASLLCTWFSANFIMAPLSRLAELTRTIGTPDIRKRLPDAGRGELGDITRSFNTMLDRLEGQFNSQRDFLRDAGHELRTPLTIIRGHLELLPNELNEEAHQQTIDLLLDETDRMSRLVGELSLLAQADRPEFLSYRAFQLEEFTATVFRKATGMANRHWELTTTSNQTVIADPDKLTQCMINLLANAVDHTISMDTIEIGSGIARCGAIHLWVSDTGVGIAPELQSRVFERFYRGRTSLEQSALNSLGSGLGLSIVQAIVSAHGGRLSLTSSLGSGAKFTLIIPSRPGSPIDG